MGKSIIKARSFWIEFSIQEFLKYWQLPIQNSLNVYISQKVDSWLNIHTCSTIISSIFKYCTLFMKICLPHSQLLIEIITWLIVYHLSHIDISLSVIQKTSHDIVDDYPESALHIIKWLAISSVIILFLSIITLLSSCAYHCIAWPPYIILAMS